jgi:putative ABC transport system permease protein
MRYLPYILKHLRRHWLRSLLTVLAMTFCIFVFCVLQTFLAALNQNLKAGNASRLVTRHAVSLVFNLPQAYRDRIAGIAGVQNVAMENWFGGARKAGDFKDFFPNLAVEAEPFLQMYPEYILGDEEKRAWLDDQSGCILGPATAERFGWKVGDTFQLESFIPPYRIGKPFEFTVRGIYKTDEQRYPGTDKTVMFFHYKYLYEATGRRVGVGTYVTQIADPAQAGAVSRAIDGLFENSEAQTHTETEQQFRASFIAMAGNLALLLNFIGLTVIFMILLVTANTMSMAVRERRTEMGVLKTLGFTSGKVMGLVLAEAGVLGALGGAIGIFFSTGMIQAMPHLPFVGDAVRGIANFGLPAKVALTGFSLALGIGVLAGLVPAYAAYRARITDLLRQV